MARLIKNLAGSVGLIVAGGTIILIMLYVWRKGKIVIIENNKTVRMVELGAGAGMVLLGLVSAVWSCKEYQDDNDSPTLDA